MRATAWLLVALGSAWIVCASPSAARADGDGYQRFIVECGFSHARKDDPILFPRRAGASHVHDFFGNVLTDRRPGYARMLDGDTTCAHRAATAAYWVPAIRDRRTGVVTHAVSLRAYYYATEAMDDDPVAPFPRGFSAVSDQGAWMCRNTERLEDAPDCTGRLTWATGVGIVVVFDDVCWNGVSPGRRADADWSTHVSQLVAGECPGGHVQLPWLSLQVRFPIVDASHHEMVSEPHRGIHGDYWNTWRQRGLAALVRRCLQPGQADCHEVSTREG